MLSDTTRAQLQPHLQWTHADTQAALLEPSFKVTFEAWTEQDTEAFWQELASQ